jgi:hypothetical protein
VTLKESSDDDGKPQIRAKPSVPKAKWSAADLQRSITRSLRFLQNRKKEAPFRTLKLPDSIDWLNADVMRGKALVDAETRANMAGTYNFSALSCLETSRAHAMKIDGLCKDLPTLTGDLKEDTMAMKAWRADVRTKSKEWLGHIQIRSDMGVKLAAALFQKETQFIRQEVAKSILLHSAPTATHLFRDNEKVHKAMEAVEKHRPYTPRPYVPKTPYFSSGSSKSWEMGAARTASAHQGQKTQQRQEKKKGAKYQKAGNPNGYPLPRQK